MCKVKKKVGWSIALVTLFIVVGIATYLITLSFYESSEDLYGFPVPQNAKLIQKSGQSESYDWSKASEEDGIPFVYEIALKASGWTKGVREGASVLYKKGNHTIDLISTTKRLDIIKVT
jgi:hypothetical protein